MFFEFVQQMKKQLGQLASWLEPAAENARTRKFEPDLFLQVRLAPDQFPFVRQVQIVCDTAKLACARLIGKEKEAPSFPDDEKTMADLRTRIDNTIKYLDGLTRTDFEGAATRSITQPRWEGKTMAGADYFVEHAVPNFFFHLAHAYAILRHSGVTLGKRDYLGKLTYR